MRSIPRFPAAFLLATGLCSCSLMDFDGLASGPEGIAGASGVSGLGLDHGGGGASGDFDAGPTGGSAGMAGSGETPAATNLILNPGFEEVSSRWTAVGGCMLGLSSESPHTGSSCLLITKRAETWQGPGYDLTAVLTRNASYRATIWARISAGSQTMQLTYKHRCEEQTDDTYTPFGANRVSTDWTELSASFVVADCPATQSLIYVEGPAAEIDFYIDDASLVLETP
jgi:hypothetical protein